MAPATLIQLTGEEDTHAVRQLVAASVGDRLILDVPRGHRAFSRQVRLKLVARQAAARGQTLALVTRDLELRERAGELHLSAFRTVAQAQRAKRWKEGVRPLELPDAPAAVGRRDRETLVERRQALRARRPWGESVMVIGLIVGVMIVLVSLLLLAVPSAEITLTPRQVGSEYSFPLTIDPNAQESDVLNSILRGEVRVQSVQGTEGIPVTGRRDVPSARATGQISFVNVTGVAITIPAGTVVSTSSGTPIRFATTESVGLPGQLNAQASAAIEAVDAGPIGNVGPLQINLVEGAAATAVRAFNDGPTEGGSVEQRAVITAQDKTQLLEQLRQRLLQEGQAALDASLAQEGSHKFAVPGTVGIEITAESYNGAVDDPVDILTLELRARLTAIVVSRDEIERIAFRGLRQQIPEGFTLLDQGQRVSASEAIFGPEGLPVITVTASGVAGAQLSDQGIRSLVRGRPVAEAQSLLTQSLPLTEPPTITVAPDGWQRMPYLPVRIFIRYATLPSDTPTAPEQPGGGSWR